MAVVIAMSQILGTDLVLTAYADSKDKAYDVTFELEDSTITDLKFDSCIIKIY